MTPDESPSAPAKKGFEANWTSRSEKTTAAPRAVAEPATVVSTRPSSAFERPMVLCAALRGDGYFCSWAAAWLRSKRKRCERGLACKLVLENTDATAHTLQAAESRTNWRLPSPFIARWHAFADAEPPHASATWAHAGPRRDA